MKTLKVNYFRFDISKENELAEYRALKKSLKGYKRDECHSFNFKYDDRQKFIARIKDNSFELDDKFIFDNQFNTIAEEGQKNGLRLFDFQEYVFPNKDIKEGYYITGEGFKLLKKLRKNTYKCNYCGKQYKQSEIKHSDHGFCTACIGYEYLTKDELHLLKLTTINEGYAKNVEIPDFLLNVYEIEQKEGRRKRLEKQQKSKLESLQNDIKTAEIEYNIFKLLIDKGIDFSNVIYYKHSNELNFNWSSGNNINESEICSFIDNLTDSDFNLLPSGLIVCDNKRQLRILEH